MLEGAVDMDKVLVTYALLLGKYGEDDPRVEAYEKKYADDERYWASMVEILLYYRTWLGLDPLPESKR